MEDEFAKLGAVFKKGDYDIIQKDVFGRIGLSYYHVIKRFFPMQAFRSKTALRYPRYRAKKQRFCETYILL